MAQTTVRIGEATRGVLRALAGAEGQPMQAVLARAVEEYRLRRFLEGVNAAYATLRRDERAWAGVEAERRAWEGVVADGLPAEERKTRKARRRAPAARRLRATRA